MSSLAFTSALRPIAVVLAAVASGCCVTPPDPSDWLNVGFRSPEQTFRSFQVSLAGDQNELGYRCLSSSFKSRYDFSVLEYAEFLDRLLEEQPYARFLAEARVVRSEPVPGYPGRHVLYAVVQELGVTVEVRVEFEAESFAELWIGDEQVQDIGLDSLNQPLESELLVNNEADWGVRGWVAADQWEFGGLTGGYDESQVTEFRLGTEWKISDFQMVDRDAEAGQAAGVPHP